MADLKRKPEVRLKLVRGPDDQATWTLVDSSRADSDLLLDLKAQLGDSLLNVDGEEQGDLEEFDDLEDVEELKEEDELAQEELNDNQLEVLAALEDDEDNEYEEDLEDDFVLKAEGDDVAEVYEEYDDEDIGAPESGGITTVSKAEFDAAMREFAEQHPDLVRQKREHPLDVIGIVEYDHIMRAVEEDDSDYEEYYQKLTESAQKDEWDIESVTSTYTNTDNRPKVISVTGAKPKTKAKPKPVAPVEPQPPASKPIVEVPTDKKERKAAVKLERREKRKNKKELKQMFSTERQKQGDRLAGKYDAPQGVSVHKL